MKDDLIVLKRILKSLERHTDDEQIEWATGGIEQAIDDLTLLPVPPRLPERHEKIAFAELILEAADMENAAAENKGVIMPTRLGMSWITLYAEQVENPRCFAIWGLDYAVRRIKSSNLNEKRKNAISGVLSRIIAGLKIENEEVIMEQCSCCLQYKDDVSEQELEDGSEAYLCEECSPTVDIPKPIELLRTRDIVFGRIGGIYYVRDTNKDANDINRRVYFTSRDLERMFSAARLDSVQEFLKGDDAA